MRVLYISGYTDSSDFVVSADSRVMFLQKPFALDVLASTVREFVTSTSLGLSIMADPHGVRVFLPVVRNNSSWGSSGI